MTNKFLLPCIFLAACLALACTRQEAAPEASIEIVSPEEGALLQSESVRIRGSAENVDRVEVDGVTAEVVGGEWEALVATDQGEVTVVATGAGATDSVTFTVDSRPPRLFVTSPERALYRTTAQGNTVTVSGTVEDVGTGLEIIKVGEQIITPTAEGNWQWDVLLRPGLNEIAVTARDIAGNEVRDIRGVMYGDYIAADETIDPAFNIWADADGIATVEAVIEDFVTPANVQTLLARYLQSEAIVVSTLTFDPIELNVALRPGVIGLEFAASNVVLEGTFEIGGEPTPVTVTLRQFRLSMDAVPVVLDDGGLDVQFSNPVLDLAAEDLTYNIGDLSDEDSQFLEDQIIFIAQAGFGHVLSEGIFSELYDPDILKRKLSVLGREIVFDLSLVAIDIFGDGVLVKTTMGMPAQRWADVRSDTPGALHRPPGPGSPATTSAPIQFTVTRNAFDRILNGVWYSGLLHHELAGSNFSGMELPFALNAGSLAAAVDSSIGTLAEPTTPAGFRLRPLFPPVAEYDVEQKRLLIRVGEMMIDLMLFPPGQAPMQVATVATFLDLSVRLDVQGVVIQLSFDTALRADVAEEPLADLDDERTEAALEQIIALIPSIVAQQLEIVGEADIEWVKLSSPTVEVHGANLDFATISLQMEPNAIALPPADPAEGM